MTKAAQAKMKVNPPLGSLPVLQYCSPQQLQIDSCYQRSLEAAASQALIRRIATHWDWGLCQPLFVARRADGGLFVVDGQHRLEAARLRSDIWQLPCVVTSFASGEEEAAAFVQLNQQRRPLTKLDLFRAALAAGDMEASQIALALKDAGLRLAQGTNNQHMAPGSIANVGGLQHCYRTHGVQVLTAALEALAKAWPGEILRYAGTLFPGLVALVIDQQPLAEPGSTSVNEIAAFAGATSQAEWHARISLALVDSNANRRITAERVFQAAWVEHRQQIAKGLQRSSAAPVQRSVAAPAPRATALLPAGRGWCEQCDQMVSGAVASRCQSQFCKMKSAA